MRTGTAQWVLITKVTEATGYTANAIRAKIKRGIWEYGKHWRKAPDNRIVLNLEAINAWLGGGNA